MLRRLIKRGELIVHDHDGKTYRYGEAKLGEEPVRARLTDRGAALHIVKDPRVGAGEAYMDGRLVMGEGDIRDLILLRQRDAIPITREPMLAEEGRLRMLEQPPEWHLAQAAE